MKRFSFFKLAAAAGLLVACSLSLRAEVTYTIVDLGVIGPVQTDSASIARAINASGEVTGNSTSSNAGGDQRAFLYSGGVMHDLGTNSSGDLSYGFGINTAGVVVGTVEASAAFYYANGTLQNIPALPNGTDGGSANGINASGAIVGSSSTTGGNSIAFLYSGGELTDLKDLQGDDTSSASGANAINNSGVIVGYCQILVYDNQTGLNNPVTKAMIYSGDQMTELPPLDQTTVATAYAINSGGEIVGVSGGNAAAWTGGNLQAVPMVAGAQGSAAHGINDAGQIVGSFGTKTFGVAHAFVCTGGVCHDLNDLATGGNLGGFEYLEIAYAINSGGTIVGEGVKPGPNGGLRGPFAFMAKPSVPTVTPPPVGVGMLTAAQDDPAPGFGSTTVPGVPVFSVAGPPAIDKSGDVAFHALIKETSKTVPVTTASNSGIWLYVGTVGSLIARTGDPTNPAPITGNPLFTKLSDPVLSSAGDLAFIGTYAGGTPKVPATSGVFVRKNGESLTLAWAVGDAAPVTGVTGVSDVVFTGFDELAVQNEGGVAFLATVKGKGITTANNTGVWSTDSKGDLQLLALKGTPLPGITPSTVTAGLTAFKPLTPVSGQSRSIDSINGYGALLVSAKSPSMLFLEAKRATAGGFTYTDPVTADSTFASFSLKAIQEPIVNDAGALAFLATVSGTGITASDNLVLATMTSSTGSIIARTGDASLPAPDAAGATTEGDLFSGLGNPVLNNGGSYAFIATLKPGVGDTTKTGTNGTGIWTNFGGTYKRLVRKGDAAPGTTGSYATFEQMALPDVGGPVFTASLSGVPASQTRGLWATSSGVPTLILETGASLQIHTTPKTVRSFSIFQVPPLVMGQSRSFEATKGNLAYTATFTDNTWGIFSTAGN